MILASAESFWTAAASLMQAPREARVLEGFAEEEAAKILILMDLVRCPAKGMVLGGHKLVQKRLAPFSAPNGHRIAVNSSGPRRRP